VADITALNREQLMEAVAQLLVAPVISEAMASVNMPSAESEVELREREIALRENFVSVERKERGSRKTMGGGNGVEAC